MDRFDAIRLFVRVVECGSFSAVAREGGVGQPAVSKQIAALEAHLGVQLLLRSSRRITITQAGQTFYESAIRLVEDLEAAESLVGSRQSSPAGLVRLSTAPALGRLYVVPILPAFLQRFPEISVEISASERHVDLIGEGVDLTHAPGWLFAPEIASGEVLCVLEGYQPEPMPVSLVHTAGRRPAAKVRALMTFIAEALPRNKYLR